LRALLALDPDLQVVGEAADGREAFQTVATLKPDLVLMDISMPGMNGIDAIFEIRRRIPGTRVIVLTVHKADEYIHEALRAGANGYVLKDATYDELRSAIRAVLAGKTFLSPEVSGRVINSFLGAPGAPLGSRPVDLLTQRERQVLKLVAEGHGNRDIAEFMNRSVKTVEKHRSNLMKKLDLHSVASLTSFAIESGLLASSDS
jgi:DNA-binding NarL/FixJ family response regulator